MTLVKFNQNNQLFPAINSILDDFFGKEYFKNVELGTTIPAVNLSENEQSFNLQMAAPGLKKEDFKIKLEGKILSISSEKKSETEEKNEKLTRKEFHYSSFERRFTMPDNIEKEGIEASYDNGILNVKVPKKVLNKETDSIQIKIS